MEALEGDFQSLLEDSEFGLMSVASELRPHSVAFDNVYDSWIDDQTSRGGVKVTNGAGL